MKLKCGSHPFMGLSLLACSVLMLVGMLLVGLGYAVVSGLVIIVLGGMLGLVLIVRLRHSLQTTAGHSKRSQPLLDQHGHPQPLTPASIAGEGDMALALVIAAAMQSRGGDIVNVKEGGVLEICDAPQQRDGLGERTDDPQR